MDNLMNQTTIHKTKWFWPWQDDQEEAWLEQLSQQGLHLKQAQIMAQYDFVQGPPQNYVYRLDFRDSLKKKTKEEYLNLFAEAGWEYLGEMGGWQYFRKLVEPGDGAEIFTDPDTKIQKYKRYLTYLSLFYASDLIFLVALPDLNREWILWLYMTIFALFSILVIITWLKIAQRIQRLKLLS